MFPKDPYQMLPQGPEIDQDSASSAINLRGGAETPQAHNCAYDIPEVTPDMNPFWGHQVSYGSGESTGLQDPTATMGQVDTDQRMDFNQAEMMNEALLQRLQVENNDSNEFQGQAVDLNAQEKLNKNKRGF